MRARTAPAILTLTLTAVLALGGCAASESEATSSQTPAPSSAAEETEEPTLEELPAGSPLTVEDRKALKDVEGVGTYTLAEGSIVLVRADAPLPEVVVNDASVKLAGMGMENEGRIIPPIGADQNLANKLSAESGRNVYVIVHLIPSTPPSDLPTWPVYLTRPFDDQFHDSIEAAKAGAIAHAGGDASTVDFVFVDYVN